MRAAPPPPGAVLWSGAGPATAADLAGLHIANLPDSTLTLLGQYWLGEAYGYFATSKFERVWVTADAEDRLAAVALLSVAPHSLGRRLLWHSGLWWRPWRWWRWLLRAQAGSAPRSVPEIVLLFVRADCRGRGLGTKLVAACAQHCSTGGLPAPAVFVPEADERAREFYRRSGFRERDRGVARGRRMVRMSL